MLDLGTIRPGSTIRIPFASFDKDDGSAITMTNYLAADILVYKNGSTTERASTSGYTATTDFDAKTGKHLAIIDLADNTTADFWNAGAEYLVALDAVTVDAVTVGGWLARFRIGYVGAWLDTTIATLASQTSFTLTSGPAENSALNGCRVIIHNIASAVQCGQAVVSAYTGATKTVTLVAGTTFTAAVGDNISIMEAMPLQATTLGRTLDVSAGGEAGVDWANVGSPTTVLGLSGTTVKTATDVETDTADIQARLPAALTAGGNIKADALAISGDATAADNLETMLDGTGGMNLTANFVGSLNGSVTGNVDGSIAGGVFGNVSGSIGSLAAQAKADVNAEVLDVLNTDTFAEPGQEAPGATVSLVKKIGYLYKIFRNKKTQTSTTFSLFADDASTVDQKATVSDDGTTATRGEIASGP